MKKLSICSDPILKRYLLKKGINAIVFDSILKEEKKIEMLSTPDNFSSNWFLDKNMGFDQV